MPSAAIVLNGGDGGLDEKDVWASAVEPDENNANGGFLYFAVGDRSNAEFGRIVKVQIGGTDTASNCTSLLQKGGHIQRVDLVWWPCIYCGSARHRHHESSLRLCDNFEVHNSFGDGYFAKVCSRRNFRDDDHHHGIWILSS